MTPPLKYTRLLPRFIRLFGINPGKHDDATEGILIQQNLDALNLKDNPFMALSYVWGNATNETANITVKNVTTGNTGSLTITTSLERVLRNIRNPNGAIGIWVDQICIDQSNNEEKGEQILLMRLIYERAGRVVASLEQSASNLALDLLQGSEWRQISDFSEALNASLKRIGQEPLRENRKNAFQAVNSLLEQGYWTRTWIWQEATAQPNNGFIFSGSKWVYLQNIIGYVVSCKQYTTTVGVLDPTWDFTTILSLTPFLDFWITRTIGIERPLLALLDQVRGAEITDPRDKIFAVLPFACDAQDFQLTYQTHTHVLYTKFALWHMIKYQSLDVITFSQGNLGRLAVDGTNGRLTTKIGEQHVDNDGATMDDDEFITLASWVPDWRKNSFAREDQWKAGMSFRPLDKSEHVFDPMLPHLYKASGSEATTYQFSFPDEQVFIRGITIHAVKVATLGCVQGKRDTTTFSLEVEEDWHRDFQAANVSNWQYSGDLLFKRTIYADVTVQAVKNIPRHTRAAFPDDELTWPHHSQDEFLQFSSLKSVTRKRAPFYTKGVSGTINDGLYGLGPLWARPGDELWILKGASVPLILRPRLSDRDIDMTTANLITGTAEEIARQEGDRNLFFVGECFVLGLMDGEVLDLMQLDNEHDPRLAQVPELEREFHPLTLY